MNLYKFEYLSHKDGYKYTWIPAHSEQCARYKVQNKNVLTDNGIPVIIEKHPQPLSNDWK